MTCMCIFNMRITTKTAAQVNRNYLADRIDYYLLINTYILFKMYCIKYDLSLISFEFKMP